MEDSTVQKLATAVHLWLDFQIVCGRGILLSEAYLSQPIGEFLMTRRTNEVEAEWNHPNLNRSGPGRPKQIDYALFSRPKHRAVSAIEAKWVAEQKADPQRFLDDVLRLECLRNTEGQAMSRFFLVAAEKADFQSNLLDYQINIPGGRTPFLPLILGQQIGVCETHIIRDGVDYPGFRKLFRQFSQSYKVDAPTSYQSTLVADEKGNHTRVMVWRVNSVRNRQTFTPNTKWVGGN